MTFDEYIQNPMGRKNAVFSQRELYRSLYMDKLDKILVRENGIVEYVLYYDKNEYYVHFKIPSEVVPNFYYDVLIKLTIPKNTVDVNLKKFDVQFYSNDPSFVFTFTHAFIANDMFIKELSSKMSKEALKKVAVEKNPNDQVGYVKSIYFAYILMNKYGLFNINTYKLKGAKLNKRKMIQDITHADEKIALRQEKGKSTRKTKKQEGDATKPRAIIKPRNTQPNQNTNTKSIYTKKVKSTNKVNKTSRVKR